MNLFKKILDTINFVFGPSLLMISIFSFKHKGLLGGSSNPIYYSPESRVGIFIGVALICIGFLRRDWRNNKTTNN